MVSLPERADHHRASEPKPHMRARAPFSTTVDDAVTTLIFAFVAPIVRIVSNIESEACNSISEGFFLSTG